MKEILHTTVVPHQRTPDICCNAGALHIPALWMTLYSSTKQGNTQCVEHWKTWFDDTMKKKNWDFCLLSHFLSRCCSPFDTMCCNTSNEE